MSKIAQEANTLARNLRSETGTGDASYKNYRPKYASIQGSLDSLEADLNAQPDNSNPLLYTQNVRTQIQTLENLHKLPHNRSTGPSVERVEAAQQLINQSVTFFYASQYSRERLAQQSN